MYTAYGFLIDDPNDCALVKLREIP